MTFEEWYEANHSRIDDDIWESSENVGVNICAENIVGLLEEAYKAGQNSKVD